MQVNRALVLLVAVSVLGCLSAISGCTGTQRIAKAQGNAQAHLDQAKEHLAKAKDAYEAEGDPRPEIDKADSQVDEAKDDIREAQAQAPHIQDKNTGILAGIEGMGRWVINAGLVAIALGIIYLLIRYGWLLPRRNASRTAEILVKAQDPNSSTSTAEAIAALRSRFPRIDAAMTKEKEKR